MARITRFLLPALILIAAFGVNSANAQTVSFKNFNTFQGIVPGVDFFASDRQMVAPYEAAATEAITRLKVLLGDELPKGAIFICSTLAQKDALYEPVVFRQGYSWVLILTTQEMRMQEQLDRMKSQIGDNIPEELRQRIESMIQESASNVDPQAVSTMARNIAFAVLQVIMNADNEYFQFRASRADDVGKSPLQDWLDVAIGAYASGDRSSVKYLQDNIDMMFPIDDVLIMPRPFVASSTTGGRDAGPGGGGGGGGFPGGGGGGGFPGGGGGFPGGGGGFPGGGQVMMMGEGFPGGGQMPKMGGGQGGRQGQGSPKSKPDGGGQMRALPKDEQDRLLFDGQAISFFDFFLEKKGIEKIRELIKFAGEGNESWDFIARPDMLGRDFSKIEAEWLEYLMKMSIPESKPTFNIESKPKSKA